MIMMVWAIMKTTVLMSDKMMSWHKPRTTEHKGEQEDDEEHQGEEEVQEQ